MFLRYFKGKNYKAFGDTDQVELSSTVTVITGSNNSGKTALLELLTGRAAEHPHRSSDTVPVRGAPTLPGWRLEVTIQCNTRDVADAIRRSTSETLAVPLFPGEGDGAVNALASLDRLKLLNEWSAGVVFTPSVVTVPVATPYLGVAESPFDVAATELRLARLKVDVGTLVLSGIARGGDRNYDIQFWTGILYRERAYRFSAERLPYGSYQIGPDEVLLPNGQNLAPVLNTLQGNPARWARYNQYVRYVLPQVHHVSTYMINNNQVAIRVWHDDPANERDDLATDLSHSGTGVGQVLSILYVLLTSDEPRTILIDEPSTFLHPGAVRALIEVLHQHPRHQYIIATHSPSVISLAEPEIVLMLEKTGSQTAIRAVDAGELDTQRRIMAVLGADLGDIFGARRVIWVEGPSERLCFTILARALGVSLHGTAILPVVATGDFDGRHAERVPAIYDGMVDGIALLPKASGFVFDRERRTEEGVKRLRDLVGDRVRFLPRVMLENYFLHEHALLHLIQRKTESETGYAQPTLREVQEALSGLQAAGSKRTRWWRQKHASDADKWRAQIHGSDVVGAVVQELTKGRHVYDKLLDAPVLMRWLVEHRPVDVEELATILRDLVEAP